MADLHALIRLHKHELDEKQRVLAAIYLELAALERQRCDILRAFEQEKGTARAADEINYTFASYAESVRDRVAKLEQQEAEVQERVETAKESLMETFAELKKFQMTQDERDRLAEEERKFKESQAMDAIGLENYRRKKEQSKE
jgi:flagellar export protein FliJ